MKDDPRIGLCASCVYVRIVQHPRGGDDYYRCGKHDEDPAYPKYPPLPVRHCDAYRNAGATERE
jgi:hypothetical protein